VTGMLFGLELVGSVGLMHGIELAAGSWRNPCRCVCSFCELPPTIGGDVDSVKIHCLMNGSCLSHCILLHTGVSRSSACKPSRPRTRAILQSIISKDGSLVLAPDGLRAKPGLILSDTDTGHYPSDTEMLGCLIWYRLAGMLVVVEKSSTSLVFTIEKRVK
jgi:hypothetical protein